MFHLPLNDDCWGNSENIQVCAGYHEMTNVKVPSAGSKVLMRSEFFPHLVKFQYSRNSNAKNTWGNSENIHVDTSAIIDDDVNEARLGFTELRRSEYFNLGRFCQSLIRLTTLIKVIIISD